VKTKRHEIFIREDILRCYKDLSLISNISNKQNKLKESKIKKELKILFRELGRQVPESESVKWS
jgi:hypothetical protein